MAETFEARIEDTMKERMSESAGIVYAAIDGARRKNDDENDEQEDFSELFKIWANRRVRSIVRYVRPSLIH